MYCHGLKAENKEYSRYNFLDAKINQENRWDAKRNRQFEIPASTHLCGTILETIINKECSSNIKKED